MDRKQFKKRLWNELDSTKYNGRITICFMMVLALFLGGCSFPSSLDTSIPYSAPQSSDNSGMESQTDQFDFNQPLTLKTPEPAAGESPRILFIGNSHTYTNDLPGMFGQIAKAMEHECDVQEITQGAYSLTKFADSSDEEGMAVDRKLTEEKWDFVILQEKTSEAMFSAKKTMLSAARTLDEKICAAGGQTALLMTWSPKEGSGIMGLEYVQSVLSQNLIDVSEELDSLLIPGGIAFMRCMDQYPQIELWGEDGQHPSVEGTYLAACVAYAVIFQESPEGCTYTANLDDETAARLQTLAGGFLAE